MYGLLAILTFILSSAVYSCWGDCSSEGWALFYYSLCVYIPITLFSVDKVVSSKNAYVINFSKAIISYSISCVMLLFISYTCGWYAYTSSNFEIGILTIVIYLITLVPCLSKKRQQK